MELIKEKKQTSKKSRPAKEKNSSPTIPSLKFRHDVPELDSISNVTAIEEPESSLATDMDNWNLPYSDIIEVIQSAEESVVRENHSENDIEITNSTSTEENHDVSRAIEEKETTTIVSGPVEDIMHEPSAPELCELDLFQIQQINSAILKEIQDNQQRESQHLNVIKSILINPFTETELNQYYCNAKMKFVMEFEERSTKYFSDRHYRMKKSQLYAHLHKFYSLHKEVFSLKFDMEQIPKSFSAMRKKIWTENKVTETFKGECRDKKTCYFKVSYNSATYHENWAKSFHTTLLSFTQICCGTYRGERILCKIEKRMIDNLITEIILNSKSTQDNNLIIEAIAAVFHFYQKKEMDKIYFNCIDVWLQQLLAEFNTTSRFEENLIFISYILRCPTAGALSAVKSLQIDSGDIDGSVALLWFFLKPKLQFEDNRKKEKPLKDNESDWMVIDSEGEDCNDDPTFVHPNETVLMGLLDRIPFREIFCKMLQIKDYQLPNFVSGYNLLKCISFCTVFVNVLTDGIQSFEGDKYKNFLKRLANIVKHISEFVTTIYSQYRSSMYPTDPMIVGRIVTEYNIFMIRVCEHLNRNRSVTQYLSQLNYDHLEGNTYWKIYVYLLTQFPEDLTIDFNRNFKEKYMTEFQFSSSNCTIMQWSTKDIYFLLENLSTLAMGCGRRDFEFVETVARDLFYVGFVMPDLSSICYKVVRDLLCAIASDFPCILDNILREIQIHIETIDSLSLYLLKELPFQKWQPTMDILDIIETLLISHPLGTVQHNIGRTIISYMNWNFLDDDRLFLDYQFQCKAAMVALKALHSRFPAKESYGKVTLSGPELDPNKAYISWTWKLISKLKLHSMDQCRNFKMQKFRNNAANIISPVRLEMLPFLDTLTNESANPIAIYISMLMCQHGNDCLEVSERGLKILQRLCNNNTPMFILIRCLDLIVPLFLSSPDTISDNADCEVIINYIVKDNRGFLSLKWQPNDEIELMREMIVNQLVDIYSYGQEYAEVASILWLKLLTKTPSWNLNPNRLYLLNAIIEFSFTVPTLWQNCRQYFLNLVLTSKLTARNPDFIWFYFVITDAKRIYYEARTNLWNNLIDKVGMGNVSLDVAVKSLNKDLSTSELAVFKWAELIKRVDSTCALLPLILNQFSNLYFVFQTSRLGKMNPIHQYNPRLINDVVKKLEALSSEYQQMDSKETQPYSSILSKICRQTGELVKLNAVVNSDCLEADLYSSGHICMATIRNSMKKMANHWQLISYRQKVKQPVVSSKSNDSMKSRSFDILRTIGLYPYPEKLIINLSSSDGDDLKEPSMINNINHLIDKMNEAFGRMIYFTNEQLEIERKLYVCTPQSFTQSVKCYPNQCLGAARIEVRYKEWMFRPGYNDKYLQSMINLSKSINENRNTDLVNFLFTWYYQLSCDANNCNTGYHSRCSKSIRQCLEKFPMLQMQWEERYPFLKSFIQSIKAELMILMASHYKTEATTCIEIAMKSQDYVDAIMDILNLDQMDSLIYLCVLREIKNRFKIGKNDKVTLICLSCLHLSDTMIKDGWTTKHLEAAIEIMFNLLGSSSSEMFDLVAKEMYILMLNRTDQTFTFIMERTFSNVSLTARLLSVFFGVLGLPMKEGKTIIEWKKVESVNRVLTREMLIDFITFLTNSQNNQWLTGCYPALVQPLTTLFEITIYWLLSKIDSNERQIVQKMVSDLYNPLIIMTDNAQVVVTSFFQAALLFQDTAFLLHWYIDLFANNTIPMKTKTHEYVAKAMESLPWSEYIPSRQDINDIHRLFLQPYTHSLTQYGPVLAEIIIDIDWNNINVITHDQWDSDILSKIYFISIRVSYELRENVVGLKTFYDQIYAMNWHVVNETTYVEALNWIIQSSPQSFIARLDVVRPTVEWHILKLLLIAAGYIDNSENVLPCSCNPMMRLKQQRLVQAVCRLFGMNSGCTNLIPSLHYFLKIMFEYYFRDTNSLDAASEFAREILILLNHKTLAKEILNVLEARITASHSEIMLNSCICATVDTSKPTTCLTRLFDFLVELYFAHYSSKESNPWAYIEERCLPFVKKLELEKLQSGHHFLGLHLLTVLRWKWSEQTALSAAHFCSSLLDWLTVFQISEENECALVLLWSMAICCCAHNYYNYQDDRNLQRIIIYLKAKHAKDEGWGRSLFNAIGLTKANRREICLKYMTFLLIESFPGVSECQKETSTKFVQQFLAEIKTNKLAAFRAQLEPLQTIAKTPLEFNVGLLQVVRKFYSNDFFRNVTEYWKFT